MNNSDILLLDTNTVLYLIDGDEKVLQLIHKKISAINFIVEIELLSWPSLTTELEDVINSFIKDARYFDYSFHLKEFTIELRQKYNLKLGDAFIAATALYYDLTLISADKIFSRIPSIKLVNFTPSVTSK